MVDFLESIIAFIIVMCIYAILFWCLSWLLAWGWNNIVVDAFESMPTVETKQVLVIVIGIYITRQIIKWW